MVFQRLHLNHWFKVVSASIVIAENAMLAYQQNFVGGASFLKKILYSSEK